MSAKLKAAVLGATGYSGLELTRILLRHPRLEKPLLLRRAADNGASDLADVFPALSGNGGYPLHPLSWPALKQQGVQLLFLATPHEISRSLVPEAIAHGMRVIDLSGAWRLKQEQHRAIYGFQDSDAAAAEELTGKAVYGLPELNSDRLATAQLVANPGCYATSVILALAPLVKSGVIDRNRGIISDSKSGVSGAGKEPTPKTHFVSVADNLSAYSVFSHRHVGEMVEQLGLNAHELIFTPHLLPIPRGILSTIYVYLDRQMTSAEVESSFRDFYSGKRWVRVFQSPKLPEVQFSLHTNYCDLGFCLAQDGRRLVVISCIDNLLKGAAGQAVQNMNVMYGWAEDEGLQ
ncbi:N-acetyl-gamma-glutamyl-phosphate reductase [Candidatus Sulfotelmatobacter kueseliae]|uniref:N-acetyl-gamma-glutamyl-phosphate reductase n=1 Tax=Candidatus Sulfotelmatobacter kueseliae TaxID=2042962 RepID=A0A2U3KTA9_9BACT|nr:N-acetyl-gamma-glutamyl-phosphate reductase [Candidatus Sulfotelmatobacter kueseliae]